MHEGGVQSQRGGVPCQRPHGRLALRADHAVHHNTYKQITGQELLQGGFVTIMAGFDAGMPRLETFERELHASPPECLRCIAQHWPAEFLKQAPEGDSRAGPGGGRPEHLQANRLGGGQVGGSGSELGPG